MDAAREKTANLPRYVKERLSLSGFLPTTSFGGYVSALAFLFIHFPAKFGEDIKLRPSLSSPTLFTFYKRRSIVYEHVGALFIFSFFYFFFAILFSQFLSLTSLLHVAYFLPPSHPNTFSLAG